MTTTALEISNERRELAKLDKFESIQDMMGLAQTLIESKLIPGSFDSPEKVVTVIQKGREIGLPPVSALENIYYIQGRATSSINVLMALAQNAGVGFKTVKNFEPVMGPVTDTNGAPVMNEDGSIKQKAVDYVTTIRVFRKHEKLDGMIIENDVEFFYTEAQSMGLLSKDNWKKQLKNMMWTRCMSRAARRHAADALLGMYEVTEIADSSNVKYTMDEDMNATVIQN